RVHAVGAVRLDGGAVPLGPRRDGRRVARTAHRANAGGLARPRAALYRRLRLAAVRDHGRLLRQGVARRGRELEQDGEGGEGARMSEPTRADAVAAQREIRRDARRELLLIPKAGLALLIVVAIVVLRELYLR